MLTYQKILLSNIHFPSFTHAAKYISHFRPATRMEIERLTWDDDRLGAGSSNRATDVARVRSGNFYKMKDEEFRLNVSGCTDTARLFLQALIANTWSPLYALSNDPPADDRDTMAGLLQDICFGETIDRAQIDII